MSCTPIPVTRCPGSLSRPNILCHCPRHVQIFVPIDGTSQVFRCTVSNELTGPSCPLDIYLEPIYLRLPRIQDHPSYESERVCPIGLDTQRPWWLADSPVKVRDRLTKVESAMIEGIHTNPKQTHKSANDRVEYDRDNEGPLHLRAGCLETLHVPPRFSRRPVVALKKQGQTLGSDAERRNLCLQWSLPHQ